MFKELRRNGFCGGFTLVELIITLVIVGLLVGVSLMTISGTLPTFKLSKASRELFNSMLMAKSKAVSLNKNYRLNVINSTSFKIQYYDTGAWVDDGGITTLPPDISIPTSPFNYVTNCSTNLEFTSRGILNVLNGAQTNPFIIVKNTINNQQKSITVNIGGNIDIN